MKWLIGGIMVAVVCGLVFLGSLAMEQRGRQVEIAGRVAVQELEAREQEARAAQEQGRADQVVAQMQPAVIDASGEAAVDLVNAEQSWSLLVSLAQGYQRMALQDAMDREAERAWRSIERVALVLALFVAGLVVLSRRAR